MLPGEAQVESRSIVRHCKQTHGQRATACHSRGGTWEPVGHCMAYLPPLPPSRSHETRAVSTLCGSQPSPSAATSSALARPRDLPAWLDRPLGAAPGTTSAAPMQGERASERSLTPSRIKRSSAIAGLDPLTVRNWSTSDLDRLVNVTNHDTIDQNSTRHTLKSRVRV